jgi:hypothetical protein
MKLISKWKMFAATLAMGCALLYGSQTAPVVASDHDDGETNIKSRNLSLTDLYVFREDWHSGNAADAANLVFVMNTNPRSVPRQHYFFNTEAVYSFHVSPKATVDTAVDGVDTTRFDFRFGAPDASNRQSIQMDVVRLDAAGAVVTQATVTDGLTTTAPPLLGNPNPAPVTNSLTIDGTTMSLFAGLREDPFFFDVEAFFRVRAAAAGGGPAAGFAPAIDAVDFAQGYNVNAVVLSVPISFLQQGGSETVFDVWESVSAPSDLAARQ